MTGKSFENYTEKSTKQLLSQLPLSQAFNLSQLDTFANSLKAYRLTIGSTLMQENQPNDSLYFICQGSLNVVKNTSDNSQKILQTLSTGKVVGEASFFDHAACSATIIAIEESIILALDRASFIELSSESPHCALALALELFRLLTQRLRKTSSELVNLL
jgi:CRP/FNR family transcriptional regulator, cyclic AMP receptor protein